MTPRSGEVHWGHSRRWVLKTLGLGGVASVAGCTGGLNPTADTQTAGESGGSGDVGELIATFGADVKNFDPTKINDTTSAKAFGLVYETLLGTDFEGTPQPYLAKSVERTDDRTYRATLREDITFHNGDTLTAEDVKKTFERYEGAPREADVYDWYSTSEVVDDHTLDIELSRPYAPFKFAIGNVPIVPAAVADGDLALKDDPVGTGPYTFVEHEPDSLFRIERNDDYWFEGSEAVPATPTIDTITFRVIVEQSAQLAALRGGDVDFINTPPASSIKELKEDEKFTVTERTAGGFDMLIYPMHDEADTPFQNRDVRLGVNRLIPREAIVKTVYNGIGIPAYAPISPLAGEFASQSFQQELRDEYAGYDTEKATDLLEQGFQEAGFETPFQTKIITNENPQRVKWAQLIQESMNETEFFEIGLEKFEWNTYVGKILSKSSHTLENLVALGWSAGWDPDAYVHNLFHSEQSTPNCCNVNHYENERIDELIDQGLRTLDTEKRKEIYRELQRVIVEESPMAFIRFGKEQAAMWTDRIERFRMYPINGAEYAGVYAPYADTAARLTK